MHRAGSRLAGRGADSGAAVIGLLARAAWFVEGEVRAIAGLVPAGGTCVDVGAGYGLYTVAMAAAVGPSGTVHAVEPQNEPNRVIDAVVRLCGTTDRVVRHDVALSDRPGRTMLSVPVRCGRAVHGRAFVTRGAVHAGPNAEQFRTERRQEVRLSTLDALAGQQRLTRLDMIKADVEGAELQVLRGAVGTIDRFRPTVQLEIEDRHLRKFGNSTHDVTSFLLDREYLMHGWDGDRWVPTRSANPGLRNYLFVPQAGG